MHVSYPTSIYIIIYIKFEKPAQVATNKNDDKAMMMDIKKAADEKDREVQNMMEKNSLLFEKIQRLEREIEQKKEMEKEKQSENASLQDLLKQTLSRVNLLEDNLKTQKTNQNPQGTDQPAPAKPELPKKGRVPDKDLEKATADSSGESGESDASEEEDQWVRTPQGQVATLTYYYVNKFPR